MAIVGLPNFISHIRSGTVKALAVDSDARAPLFPDVPTLSELGFPNLAPVYFGFVAPAGTPKPIIQRLHEEISHIGNEPSFRDKYLVQRGLDPQFGTPEQFADYLQKSRVIGVEFSAPAPELSADVANAVADAFVELQQSAKRESAVAAVLHGAKKRSTPSFSGGPEPVKFRVLTLW